MHNNAYIQKAKQAALQRYETLLILSNHGQSNFVFNINFKLSAVRIQQHCQFFFFKWPNLTAALITELHFEFWCHGLQTEVFLSTYAKKKKKIITHSKLHVEAYY